MPRKKKEDISEDVIPDVVTLVAELPDQCLRCGNKGHEPNELCDAMQ